MKHLHITDNKFHPKSDVEYEAILYLLNEDIFCWEYMRPEVRDFVENLTEEEKNFIRSKRA